MQLYRTAIVDVYNHPTNDVVNCVINVSDVITGKMIEVNILAVVGVISNPDFVVVNVNVNLMVDFAIVIINGIAFQPMVIDVDDSIHFIVVVDVINKN